LLPDRNVVPTGQVPPARDQRALVLALLDRRSVEVGEPEEQRNDEKERDGDGLPGDAEPTAFMRARDDQRSIVGPRTG
jgi:hypothetical protein